jgi:hypothetical protein
VANYCENRYETLGSTKRAEFLDWLKRCCFNILYRAPVVTDIQRVNNYLKSHLRFSLICGFNAYLRLYKRYFFVIDACRELGVKLFASQEGRCSVKLVNCHKNVESVACTDRKRSVEQ